MRRRRNNLGRSARQRVRTGAIEIDEAVVNDAAKAFANGFPACGLDPSSEFVAPPRASTAMPRPQRIPIRDAETGQARNADVFVIADPEARSPVHGYNATYVRPDGGRFDRIVLKVKPGLCMPAYDWAEEIKGILTHEVAHASDPGILRYRRAAPSAEDERCEYFNHPAEVTAFVAQARREITSFHAVMQANKLRRSGRTLRTPADLLRVLSPTYGAMYSCLRPKMKRRFLRMAARVWEEQKEKL